MLTTEIKNLTRALLALLVALNLTGSTLRALDILEPCLDPLEDCWDGPVIEVPVDLPRPEDDETPGPGLADLVAHKIDPALIQMLRRLRSEAVRGGDDDEGRSASRRGPRVRWAVLSELLAADLYHELTDATVDEASGSAHETPYGNILVRIVLKEVILLDCEGIAGPVGTDNDPQAEDLLGDGGGAMQMGLGAHLVVEVRHIDEGFGMRFPLSVKVCHDGVALATALDRVRIHRPFRRGFINHEEPTVTSAVKIFSFLFLGGDPLECENEADIDGDDQVSIVDGIKLLDFLYRGGVQPAEPFDRSDFAHFDTNLQCGEKGFNAIVAHHDRLPDLEDLLDNILNPNACTLATRGMTKCIDGLENVCMVENGIGSWVPINPEQPCSLVGGGTFPDPGETETPFGN